MSRKKTCAIRLGRLSEIPSEKVAKMLPTLMKIGSASDKMAYRAETTVLPTVEPTQEKRRR